MSNLSYKDFVKLAPESGTIRIIHETDYCTGRSKPLKITRNGDGSIDAVCFRCGRSGYRAGSFQDRLSNKKADGVAGNIGNGESDKSGSNTRNKYDPSWYSLPRGVSQDIESWPLEARYWCRSHLSDQFITVNRLCYDPQTKRVCIPLPVNSKRTGYVERSVMPDDDGPKYVNHIHPHDSFVLYTDKGTRGLVLVEDYISWAIVSEVCSCLCLLSTDMSTQNLIFAIDYDRFIVWLDNDNPIVKMKQVKLRNRLAMFGEAVVFKGTDPKHYSLMEIDRIVQESFE